MVNFFDIISVLYSLNSLRVLWRLLRNWRAFWDDDVTPADRSLANNLAFFVLIPLGVFLHEAGHALATWQVGGQVVDFQWRVFWGYILPQGNFTPLQDWWISFSGPLVSILIGLLPIPLLPRLGRSVWGVLLYAFIRQEIFYALLWYPVISVMGFGGDWIRIYDFSVMPWAQVVLAGHAALLFGLWRLDRSGWAARWRVRRDASAAAELEKLENAITLMPGQAKPLAALALFFFEHDENTLARRYERRALRLAPSDPHVQMMRALVAHGQRRYQDAQEAAQAALTNTLAVDEQARMQQVLAHALINQGQHAAAVTHFDQAIRLAPGSARLYYWRAISKRALGRAAEARQDFEEAARLAPNDGLREAAQSGLKHTPVQ
jgi:Flp pilus assembly protein TadD